MFSCGKNIYSHVHVHVYLMWTKGDLSTTELQQGSNELSSDIHRHDPLFVRVPPNDGMANETLIDLPRTTRREESYNKALQHMHG